MFTSTKLILNELNFFLYMIDHSAETVKDIDDPDLILIWSIRRNQGYQLMYKVRNLI